MTLPPKRTKEVLPNFLRDELWRKVWDWDQRRANELRKVLAKLGYYVAISRNDDPGAAGMVENHRTALHTIINELKPDDISAVYEVARRLLLMPDQVGVNELVAKANAETMAWYEATYGKSGRKGRKTRKAADTLEASPQQG